MEGLATLKAKLLDLVFPPTCFACGTPGQYMCTACLPSTLVARQRCIICGADSLNGLTHARCTNTITPWGASSWLSYQDMAIRKLIWSGKYSFARHVFEQMGIAWAHALQKELPSSIFQNACISAIPLHTSKLRHRGFNQAEVLANSLSKTLTLPYVPLLIRAKNTKPQKDLDRNTRLENLQAAFTITPQDLSPIKTIILIDDIITSGSTMRSATKTLKQQYKDINIWCLGFAQD
jgi:competence protein ComFC